MPDLEADQPLVNFLCGLPVGLGEEDPHKLVGEITFAAAPGVHFDLTHGEIARRLLTGLDTPAAVEARPFFGAGGRVARFGNTRKFLSEAEAEQLCACVDQIGHPYKAALGEATTLLELWEYTPVRTPNGVAGVALLSLPIWLWARLLAFATSHSWEQGSSPWHCFEPKQQMIATGSADTITHAELYPLWSSAESVEVVYAYPPFSRIDGHGGKRWQDQLGPQGIWTAAWTENWLRREFIPTAVAQVFLEADQAREVQQIRSKLPSQPTSLSAATQPRHLVPFVETIQTYCTGYDHVHLAATVVQPYYTALIQLAKAGTLPHAALDYMGGKLQIGHPRTAEAILFHLDLHRTRIKNVAAEVHSQVDLLSRVFLAFLRDPTFQAPESTVRAAAQATLPFWEQCRFEGRFRYLPSASMTQLTWSYHDASERWLRKSSRSCCEVVSMI